MKIKKGDNVIVISGKDKGKIGKVLQTSPKTYKVVVEGVNVVSKHKKPRSAQDKGGIVKQTNPIDSSNVMVICPNCNKATRVSHKEIDDKKVRVCKKCGASLDKDFVKAIKKEAKVDKTKSTKKTAKEENLVEEAKLEKALDVKENKDVRPNKERKASTKEKSTEKKSVVKSATKAKKAE